MWGVGLIFFSSKFSRCCTRYWLEKISRRKMKLKIFSVKLIKFMSFSEQSPCKMWRIFFVQGGGGNYSLFSGRTCNQFFWSLWFFFLWISLNFVNKRSMGLHARKNVLIGCFISKGDRQPLFFKISNWLTFKLGNFFVFYSN